MQYMVRVTSYLKGLISLFGEWQIQRFNTKGTIGPIRPILKNPNSIATVLTNTSLWNVVVSMLIEWWATICDTGSAFNQIRTNMIVMVLVQI